MSHRVDTNKNNIVIRSQLPVSGGEESQKLDFDYNPTAPPPKYETTLLNNNIISGNISINIHSNEELLSLISLINSMNISKNVIKKKIDDINLTSRKNSINTKIKNYYNLIKNKFQSYMNPT